MYQAVIFDMDGLLINSEPLWVKAEQEIFKKVGIDLTESQCKETVGMVLDQVVAYRYQQKPWHTISIDTVIQMITDTMITLIKRHGQPMPGVMQVLDFFKQKNVKIGLATASTSALMQTSMQTLGITAYFDHLQSASDFEYSKPHPQVYIETAKALQVAPQKCIAFEDSIPGMIAVKAARMTLVAVPDPVFKSDPRLCLADLILDSLTEFSQQHYEQITRMR